MVLSRKFLPNVLRCESWLRILLGKDIQVGGNIYSLPREAEPEQWLGGNIPRGAHYLHT